MHGADARTSRSDSPQSFASATLPTTSNGECKNDRPLFYCESHPCHLKAVPPTPLRTEGGGNIDLDKMYEWLWNLDEGVDLSAIQLQELLEMIVNRYYPKVNGKRGLPIEIYDEVKVYGDCGPKCFSDIYAYYLGTFIFGGLFSSTTYEYHKISVVTA